MSNFYTGLYSAVVTPLNDDFTINVSVIPQYYNLLVDGENAGIFLTGTSGESMSLSVAERKTLLTEWMKVRDAAEKKLDIVVQCGAQSQADCIELVTHAASLGVHGVSVMAPCFFKPSTIDDLVRFVAPIAAAAPATPFLYYHFPSITGVTWPLAKVLAALAPEVPTLAAAKFTSQDTWDYCNASQVKRVGAVFPDKMDTVQILPGFEPQFSASVADGAEAWIGICFNVAGPLFMRIQRDRANAPGLQVAATGILNAIDTATASTGAISPSALAGAVKHILSVRIGMPFGPVRPPLTPFTSDNARRLEARLVALGWKNLQWTSATAAATPTKRPRSGSAMHCGSPHNEESGTA